MVVFLSHFPFQESIHGIDKLRQLKETKKHKTNKTKQTVEINFSQVNTIKAKKMAQRNLM